MPSPLTAALKRRRASLRRQTLAAMSERELRAWDGDFAQWTHEGQAAPQGEWRTWVMMAGRGFGKTRAGAEWVLSLVRGERVGVDVHGIGYVIADHSEGGLSPEGWARKAAAAAEMHGAARVVAEANMGGRMVESVLRGAGMRIPVRPVHASESKVARAAPVAALFEAGKARFAGRFPELEDELAGLAWNGRYEGHPVAGPGRCDGLGDDGADAGAGAG